MLLWEMTWRPFCTEIAFVGKSSKKYVLPRQKTEQESNFLCKRRRQKSQERDKKILTKETKKLNKIGKKLDKEQLRARHNK